MKDTAVCQPDLFKTQKPENSSLPITIELSGLGPIPGFKNAKVMRTWMDKATKRKMFLNGEYWIAERSIKIRSILYLQPAMQAWMDRATNLIESQLRSALATSGAAIQTAALARSLIATLLPLDDCWTSFAEVTVKSQLCPKGQEGATITIEAL